MACGPAFAALAPPAYGPEVDYARPPAHPSRPLRPAAYAGKYRNDNFGDLDIVEDGETLTLRLGPAPRAFPLRHRDREVFTYRPRGENAAGPAAVTFPVGPGRAAVRIVVENLDARGQGTFDRLGRR